MKVILLKELRGRGGEGDIIEVSRGFANNYLLTQGYAVQATPGNLKQLEQRKRNIEKREEVRIADANALVEKLNGATVKVDAQVGEEGQLFGSVTAPMIADAIKDALDVEVDRRRIELGKPIKQVGAYPVDINVYRTIKATVNVVIEGDDVAEAEAAADAAGEAVADAIEAEVEAVAAEVVAADVAEQVEEALETESE
ncbi:MAG: 50S ribosomal protein L9 [Eggerthellaceae bacterium]|nr:50S ribosomal protein L9 [Eggerthellaceae bacterium]